MICHMQRRLRGSGLVLGSSRNDEMLENVDMTHGALLRWVRNRRQGVPDHEITDQQCPRARSRPRRSRCGSRPSSRRISAFGLQVSEPSLGRSSACIARGDTTTASSQGDQLIQTAGCFGRCSGTVEAADTPEFAEPDMGSDQMNRRHRVGAAAVLLGVLAVAGCTSMGAKDQAVIDRLEKLDIVAIPAGATKISSTQTKGGGSDFPAIRGASSVLVVYASPLPAARVGEFYQQTYDKSWRLKDFGVGPTGKWLGVSGANRSDPQTNVTIDARPPAVNDEAPASTKSVVSLTVSATRQ